MAKRGMKTKIEIKKIVKKSSLGPICNKRRNGLFSKASQICLLSGAQIAILATPSSSESNVSFYSFGHSSVDGVVSAFLSGQRPVPDADDKEMREDVGICLTRKNLGLGFWWENDSLARSENPQEISDAIDSMWTLLSNLKELRAEEAFVNNYQAFVNDHQDLKKNEKSDVVLQHGTQDPTLNLQSSTSAICCVPDDLPANFNEITQEQDQILTIWESFCVTDNNKDPLTEVNLDYDQDMDIDQLMDFETFESSLDDWTFSNNTQQEHQETTASLLTNSEAVSMKTKNTNLLSDFEALENEDLMLQRCLDEDNLRFSNVFNDFNTSTIAAL